MLDLTQILQPYQNRRIAIYGLSVMTRELLPQAERECRVIGLLDGSAGVLQGHYKTG